MSIANDEPLMGREEGRRMYEESDKLLHLAEGLQDKCEQYERRLSMLIMMGIGIIAVIGPAVFYLLQSAWPDRWDGVVFAACYGLVVGAYLSHMRIKIHRQLARERRALHGIVDMLRDLEKGIAEKNNLSALERAAFRIRLSRFDIGPG